MILEEKLNNKNNNVQKAEKDLINFFKSFGGRNASHNYILIEFGKNYFPHTIQEALERLVKRGELLKKEKNFLNEKSVWTQPVYHPNYKSMGEKFKYFFRLPPFRYWSW